MRLNGFKRICSLWLVIAMVLSLAMPAAATEAQDDPKVTFEQVDNDRVTASLLEEEEPIETEPVSIYDDTDEVRVSIFLEGASTIEHGYSTYNIAEDEDAMDYRQMLLENQYSVTAVIEETTGEELDVQWNLTLAANAISANVEYGQIEEIAKIDGVKEVVIETQYTPAVLADSEGEYDPQMAISTDMTGMTQVFSNGYTGAGTRVAIIDTGIDVDHQSFDGEAFEYSLKKNAEEMGISYEEYIASLNLLDQDEIDEVLYHMNASIKKSSMTSFDVYRSSKIAFGFNYADNDSVYIDHYGDSQSDHGSHVAGIAAANRYVKNENDEMVDSVSEYKVVGNAPDAQLLVMKIFGASGGGSESDIVAAIEDAIILGADAINLSLGTGTPEFTTDSVYAPVIELLKTTDALMVVAGGNEGMWADYSNTEVVFGNSKGLLYAEDVMTDRIASPASLTEALAVASVENHGSINSAVIGVTDAQGEEFLASYNEKLYNIMKNLNSLDVSEDGSGTPYEYVFIDGCGDPNDGELDFIDVKGKIVFISRGNQVAFSTKATYAVDRGAIATIIYNNVVDSGGMDMSAYEYEEPAVYISKAAGDMIRSMSTQQTDVDGNIYYTGTVEIISGTRVVESAEDFYTMSSFSNWGVPGDLSIKPEITAPGGNIYSVNGSLEETNQYRVYSGTSMAAPQVAGITAALKQFIREEGLVEKTGPKERQLTQSLLMSTAIPMKDADGNYYPVIQQGAGLVSADAAVNAESYIVMDNDALYDKDSGKVKVELGDDPEREGVYEFGFTLYNMTNQAQSYEMSADVFAQNITEAVSAPDSKYTAEYMSKSTIALSSYAVFSENKVSQKDNIIDVPANGSTYVSVRVVLNEDGKQWIEEHYKNGTYIQAYIFAAPVADAEGHTSSVHSIPMLAFYGSWTDSSMYEGGSYYQGEVITNYATPNTTDQSRIPYIENYYKMYVERTPNSPFYGSNYVRVAKSAGASTYALGGNPLVKEAYHPERTAIRNGAVIQQWQFYLIRSSDRRSWQVKNTTTGEIYVEGSGDENVMGAYYRTQLGAWMFPELWYAVDPYVVPLNCELPELPEGDVIEISVINWPEYYADNKLGANKTAGQGATLSISAVIDETNPVVSDITYNTDGTLDVTAVDSNYIAAVVLYTEDGKEVVSYTGSKEDIEKGEAAVFSVKTDVGGGKYLLQVFDYAMNTATYLIEVEAEDEEITFNGNLLAYDLDEGNWVFVTRYSDNLKSITETTRKYTAATAVGDTIYAFAYGTELYKLSVSDPDEAQFVTSLSVNPVDMAYNVTDDKLYAVTEDSLLVRINPDNGSMVVIGKTPVETNTLACDNNGVFYSNRYGSGSVFAYTLDAMKRTDMDYDFNGDGLVNDVDCQTLLEYVTGVRGNITNKNMADLDSDGDVDTYDVYLFYDKVPGTAKLLTTIGLSSKYMQTMECDPNSGELYWASYSTEMFGETEVGFSVIYGIDTETGETTRFGDVWDQLSCLIILDKHEGAIYEPAGGVTGLGGAEDKFYDNTVEQSGVAYLMGVDNSQKDAYLTAQEEKQNVTVELKADVKATNGLYAVDYDPVNMSLVSVESSAGLHSWKNQDGRITFGYAGKTAVSAEDAVAVLSFVTSSCESKSTVTQLQVNNLHTDVISEHKTGAHSWSEWQITDSTCTNEGSKVRTCEKCGETDTVILKAEPGKHVWGETKITQEPDAEHPGIEERVCIDCGNVRLNWFMLDDVELTEEDVTDINAIYIEENCVMAAQLLGAAIDKAYRIPTTDGSMRYLLELSSTTLENADLSVKVTPYVNVASGVGYSVSLGYKDPMHDGIGTMTFWSNEPETKTEMTFYFTIGNNDVGNADVTFFHTGDSSGGNYDNYFNYVGVRGANATGSAWEHEGRQFYGKIWLDPETPVDAELVLEFKGRGSQWLRGWEHNTIYRATENGYDKSVNLVYYGLKVQLVDGAATVKVVAPTFDGSPTRYFTIELARRGNNPPALTGSSVASANLTLGESWTVDLASIFTDSDGDAMTYWVSMDGSEFEEVTDSYTITPDSVGTMVLDFKASDGDLESEVYSVVMTVRKKAELLGDVNSDGKVDGKDATMLNRYLADWSGVTIDEAAADVNGDMLVDAKDVTFITRCLAGWMDYTLD